MESLITEIFDQNYRAYWFINAMYNQFNFNGDKENIFGNIGSFNMICFPKEFDLTLEGFSELEILDPKHHLRSEID